MTQHKACQLATTLSQIGPRVFITHASVHLFQSIFVGYNFWEGPTITASVCPLHSQSHGVNVGSYANPKSKMHGLKVSRCSFNSGHKAKITIKTRFCLLAGVE